jgi:hypothetical protein
MSLKGNGQQNERDAKKKPRKRKKRNGKRNETKRKEGRGQNRREKRAEGLGVADCEPSPCAWGGGQTRTRTSRRGPQVVPPGRHGPVVAWSPIRQNRGERGRVCGKPCRGGKGSSNGLERSRVERGRHRSQAKATRGEEQLSSR